jgi:hypothetical protein
MFLAPAQFGKPDLNPLHPAWPPKSGFGYLSAHHHSPHREL